VHYFFIPLSNPDLGVFPDPSLPVSFPESFKFSFIGWFAFSSFESVACLLLGFCLGLGLVTLSLLGIFVTFSL